LSSTVANAAVSRLADVLLNVEKPARYVGGEYGQIVKTDAVLRTAVAFPDLYEIGMSNQAMKILYKGLNEREGVSCERVFAPAPDFEAALKSSGNALFTLETGSPLDSLDLIGFTFGYELGATGLLSILDAGRIPLLAKDRGDVHPIVLLGGPAASNPLPFSAFVDAVWIGEAEDAFFELASDLAELKRAGKGKLELLERIAKESAAWMPGKKATRSMDAAFSARAASPAIFPIPNMKIVQDHGSVEIMRGCPNGCRFCHAGIWYRPMRQKPMETIESEVRQFIERGGYREISLSSLSSGDYGAISPLVAKLNKTYRKRNISFQLPSLKVSSFSLPLLESISEVRKSGLTFAIETPLEAWQFSINKEVTLESVVRIMREAKARGWKQAKFYFMIGLPVYPEPGYSEEREIVEFLRNVKRQVNLSLNVNVGTFVPKAHTPYQWCAQISEEESHRRLKFIRDDLRGLGFKVSTHDPFVSMLEGLISRGDERVGELILAAYQEGCRLDAWEDHIRKDVWRQLIQDRGGQLIEENQTERQPNAPLPWDSVFSGVGKNFLRREFEKTIERKMTDPCAASCDHPCGACRDDSSIVSASAQDFDVAETEPVSAVPQHRTTYRIVFSFEKQGRAMYWPHLSLVEIFSKAFVRSGLPVFFTEGFNPLPKLDFASPLSLGILAENEVATVDMEESLDGAYFLKRLNEFLPDDLIIKEAMAFEIPEGIKKMSPAAMLWGFSYRSNDGIEHTHPAIDDKAFRVSLSLDNERIPRGLIRTALWAKGPDGERTSYFQSYRNLYMKQ